ncbi:ClpXP protease specificity-enhancing factor SspB [Rhodobacteraceae bacterium XHP0102]|nr:ClpXP protease specificity-enhancing factor SspB [Rhodobacteraceae bacterium XHP0102]
MSTDPTVSIPYGRLMHHAMRKLIQTVLEDVADNGLPGNHHFFITFATGHPDVEMADWLRGRYEAEMTIVIQHWFDALQVDEDGFSIVLNFGDNPEALRIPFDAIVTFVDPSVEFGLRFESIESGDDGPDPSDGGPDDSPDDGTGDDTRPTPEAKKPQGEVVRLDRFRKNT